MILFKKKEIEAYEKEIELDEVEGVITAKLEKESKETISKINAIINEVSSLLRSINMIGKEIEEMKLNEQQLATHHIKAINNTKRNLFIIINTPEISKVNNPNDLDDVRRDVSSILTKLGTFAGSHRKIIYEFFPSQAKRLKSKLEELTKCNQQLNLIIDDYNNKLIIFNRVKEKISAVIKMKEELLQMQEKEKEISLKIKEIIDKQDLLTKELDYFKEDKGYIKDKTILNNTLDEHKTLLHQLNQSLSNIVRAINKYDYTVGIEKRKKNILAKINKPSSITDEEITLLISLFNDIIKAIKDTKIELKNTEKDITNIESLIRMLPTHITKIKRCEQIIDDFTNKIKPFEDKMRNLEDNISALKLELELINTKGKEHSSKIKELNTLIDGNINNIKSDLEKFMIGIKIKR